MDDLVQKDTITTLWMCMMYSIEKTPAYLLVVLLALLIGVSGCDPNHVSGEDYFEQCPYELKYGRFFYMSVPVDVTPHQVSYSIGDTISFSIEISDTIFCNSREEEFVIREFPFRPLFELYRIHEEGFTSGLLEIDNPVIIDTLHNPSFQRSSSRYAGGFFSSLIYENNKYNLSFHIILNIPGRYVTNMIDNVELVDAHDFTDGLLPQYWPVVNESDCPDPRYLVNYEINGDPHYEEFAVEMTFLDEEVYKGRLYALGTDHNDPIWGGLNEFGSQEGMSTPAEWRGIFGFEVVE